jgi:hypothetical protein
MQYLTLSLLVIVVLLVMQLPRRIDDMAKAIQELSTEITEQIQKEKASTTPRY